ncbi:type II toxin-antitoxin system RelE/ParE family toxin [Spirulina sp. CCNP1310]|uniref:type II toxin-antitoxin system RelE/ParE family toxin n=1 Tax=Spirulina sp. CCNP1310 TaxID=3110249 RepID=UPI002B22073B|nr:type II toxin-antitoxin system RelE/ParE family toxin [Spirulina sp. CCNP1310]MEA5420345.1 type II toxin-antitoxin system RelE/ParE family toxin [Spirulina sp. CCNP1310]
MNCQIQISSVAESEADKAYLWIAQHLGTEPAKVWYSQLLKTIQSLAIMPNRCTLAPENAKFSQEIWQLIYGKGRNSYRILFTVLNEQNSPVIRILHIRHAARPPLLDIN